jgi:uncharacterized protein
MNVQGAGGTSGGIGKFFLGILLFVIGVYLLLKNIYVQQTFGFYSPFFRVGGTQFTSGMILIPFMIGVGILFFNYKSWIGWILGIGSLVLLMIGVITSIQFTLAGMTAFDIIIILACIAGGLGLFLNSFRKG